MPATQHLHTLDLVLIAVYLLAITLFGLRFRKHTRKASSLSQYFLADRAVPWWAIMLSIVSAETSTLTIISIPGVAFAGNFGFLQLVMGYIIGRTIVSFLFLPRYFQGQLYTAYQLIDRRFGMALHKTTAALFLFLRSAAEGVRVFAISIVVGIAIGTGDVLSISIISILTLLYTFEGGMAAVIWTDVVQMLIYIAGTLVAVLTLGNHVPGGWSHIHQVAGAAGKFHIFNFALNLTTTYTFWAGAIGGTFLTMASHGTEQLVVQRLLAARNLRQSQLALISSSLVILVQFSLFLLVGAGLFVFYGMHPAVFRTNDYIFPTFIVQQMPTGVAGLLIAAILAAAMSNLSAALNSLSSTTVVDFYIGLRPNATDHQRNLVSKSSTILWAVVLFAVAMYCVHTGGKGHVVETGLSIASVAYGSLLGVFLLGTLTHFASQTGTIIGMVCGFVINMALWLPTIVPALRPFVPEIFPHIAYTWYVLIGALVTFTIGALMSLIFRNKPRTGVAAALLALAFLASPSLHAQTKKPAAKAAPKASAARVAAAKATALPTKGPSFEQVTTLVETAIAAKQLPGAVILINHGGKTVFEQAYGNRSLEPTVEPMTEDTIFDMASLTKDLATATAIMQLYEAGKLKFDATAATYLPGFEANGKQDITVRELLTHTSGLAPDLSLKDPWGIAAPDKAEAVRRIMASTPTTPHGTKFVYSDINFETLGLIVEALSGQPLDVYAKEHIYKPLGMTNTGFHPFDRVCGEHHATGAAIDPVLDHPANGAIDIACPNNTWIPWLTDPLTAPTQYDDQLDATQNPNFGHMLRGTVHDPTARRMGGVAGHAGLFSTAHDVALFAQGLLDRLAGRPSNFPLKQATLQLMTAAEQPATVQPATIYNVDGTTTQGTPVRGYGWDINTAYSRPRGTVFPIGSFGHTGFTGTTLWMDPGSNTVVILLSNSVHPIGKGNVLALRANVATSAAQSLELYGSTPPAGSPAYNCSGHVADCTKPPAPAPSSAPAKPTTGPAADGPDSEAAAAPQQRRGPTAPRAATTAATLSGIDVLEKTHYAALAEAAKRHSGHLNVGILTNQSGSDRNGKRTIDLIATDAAKAVPGLKLIKLFSPEHGIFGHYDSTNIGAEVDPATGITVTSLYGAGSAARHPHHDQLAELDAILIDLQDVGVHFYTYETAMAYMLETSGIEQRDYHHDLEIILLDRPNPIGGVAVQGPIIDKGRESYTGYTNTPIRHGMTFGELAQYDNGESALPASDKAPASTVKGLHAHLTVIKMQNWTRTEYYDDTQLPWINPSPNLQSLAATILYPGLALLEASTASVGRGSNAPFEQFGAGTTAASPARGTTAAKPAVGQWFHGKEVADYLNARHIPGVTFTATTFAVAEDSFHYPYHGQTIEGVHVNITDRKLLDSPELGIEVVTALHHLYPADFDQTRGMRLFANQETLTALQNNEDPRAIAARWTAPLKDFTAIRAQYLLY